MNRMTRRDAEVLAYFRGLTADQINDAPMSAFQHLAKMACVGDLIHVEEAPDVIRAWDRGDSPFPRTAA